jgi:hypothetical protein
VLVGADNVEDIYELSPLQRGMLLHSIHDGAADMYLSQQTYMADGVLDTDVLVRAWQAVVAGNPVLRTSFHWEGLDKPLQVVHRAVTLPVTHHDCSGESPARQQELLARLRADDAAAGFDTTVAPLQRLAVVRLAPTRFCLVWTYHHLLMDGWSIPLFMGGLLAHYRALLTGGPPPPSPRPFRDYIAWLSGQDLEHSRSFWTEYLGGTAPNALLPLRDWDPRCGTGAVDRRDILLPDPWPRDLRAAAVRHRVTTSTMVQAAWAVVQRRYSARADIVFGAVTAGRPPELSGADQIIGVFANTLPMRITVPDHGDLGQWLRLLQQQQALMRRSEYTPLADIKRWAGLAGRQLFDSTLSIENYSATLDESLLIAEVQFRLEMLYDKISYPVAVTVKPDRGVVQFVVHRERFAPSFIDEAVAALQATLQALTTATTMAELVAAAGPAAPVTIAEPATAAVPDPVTRTAPADPTTPTERAVAAVFAEILGLEATELDVTANFFELGGDSFDAVRAIGRIEGASVALLAARPSVRELAAALAPDDAGPADLDAEIERLEQLLASKRAEKTERPQ